SVNNTQILNNVIVNNGGSGIEFDQSGTGNFVRGNRIGIDASGQALGNQGAGVFIKTLAPASLGDTTTTVTVGGTNTADRNFISANQGNGIRIGDENADGGGQSGWNT